LPPTSKPKASATRYRACEIAGIEPVLKRIEFPGGEAEALAFVVSRNLKRRHLTPRQRDEVVVKLRRLSQWRDASNIEIAKHVGVSEATARRAQGRLSSSPDEDADDDPSQTRVVHRGGQEYQMKVERIGKAQEPAPDAEPKPLRPDDTAKIAEANRRKYVESNARINKRDVRVVFKQLSDADRRGFLAEANTIDDILGWRMGALDSQRRQIADAYFDALRSNDERLKHDEIVRAWVESYESDERA
jgi:hypothetical protein